MRRPFLFLAAIVLFSVLAPAALGKGASEATISGPGLGEPITLAGEGRAGGEVLLAIADAAGFFPAVFSQSPDPMLDKRPAGTLGARYTVEYVMPGPNNEEDVLVQALYPYASPSPVSYVEPGQPFWTTEETRGGWFVASPELKAQLVAVGLPPKAPTDASAPTDSSWTVLGPIAVLVAVVVACALGIAVLVRRRPQPA